MQSEDNFQAALTTVMGQVFDAAGYTPEDSPVHQSGGLFRYRRRWEALPAGVDLAVDYQLLRHPDYPARFQVVLHRLPVAGVEPALPLAKITLSELVWDVFGVHLLSAPEHWWRFENDRSLYDGLLESGKLLAGYGLPWLDGSLTPPTDTPAA